MDRPTIKSGPANPDLPYRYGCACGAVWNASSPMPDGIEGLCGPFCQPRLSALDREGQ